MESARAGPDHMRQRMPWRGCGAQDQARTSLSETRERIGPTQVRRRPDWMRQVSCLTGPGPGSPWLTCGGPDWLRHCSAVRLTQPGPSAAFSQRCLIQSGPSWPFSRWRLTQSGYGLTSGLDATGLSWCRARAGRPASMGPAATTNTAASDACGGRCHRGYRPRPPTRP